MQLKEELIRSRNNSDSDVKRVKVSKILKALTRERDLVKRGKSSLSQNSREWLYENYYLIERVAREIESVRVSLFSRILPVTDAFVKNSESVDSESVSMLYEILSAEGYAKDPELEYVKTALLYSCLDLISVICNINGELGVKIELLRRISNFDFSPFIQGFSEAERYLRSDPTGTWQKMSRESRELYKRRIRKMAKIERVDYTTLCRTISGKACESSRHIGEYVNFDTDAPILFYLAFATVFILAFSFTVMSLVRSLSLLPILICLSLAIPLFEASFRLCAFLTSVFAKSEILPRVELDSIGEECTTLVALTCLVSKKEELDTHFSHIERLYLKSRSRKKEDTGLFIGLLADFPECSTPVSPDDAELIDVSRKWVECLNRKYGEHFVLLTRGRVLDKSTGKYGAWERKRGALLELSRLVLKKRSSVKCFGATLPVIKYIVTLDSDTDMQIGDLARMVGTMEHPLNHPLVGRVNGEARVVKGYGILQPLTLPSLSSSFKTPFSLLISGAGGFDTYHGPVFDLFHVLHRRAMFCGKGIFNVQAYFEVLDGAFPDGIVLSHDMLEGSRLRAGFIPDMFFSDSVPSGLISYSKRAHRWARGDVQSLVFTTPIVFNSRGERVRNPMPLSDRFVFVNNYLNLISPIFSCLALLLAASEPQLDGTVFLIATSPLWIYSALQLLSMLFRLSFTSLFRRFFTEALTGIRRELLHFLYSLSSLFFRAWQNFHAICTSLFRLAITKKNLLEWNTAGAVESASVKRGGVFAFFVYTLPSFVAGVSFLILSRGGWTRLVGALWCCLFLVGYITSISRKRKFSLNEKSRKRLISYAEAHFRFFLSTVDVENNYLPCDNVSISPSKAVASRTSPTNIGLYLLSLLAARDFGFIDSDTLAVKLDRTLSTVEKMKKHRGHLYNWYDTRSLDVIGEEYISSVDSGNFNVSLVTLYCGLSDYYKESPDLEKISERCRTLERDTDFALLYDNKRGLFSIGYNVRTNERDGGCYDLYMSEMRTTDYYAVARGIVEKEHWYKLSRSLTAGHLLIGSASWSGTAFEFFMPHLFLPIYENSFADEALGFAFSEQVDYSSGGVWGSSESGYFAFDRDMNYQYRAFGVPSLALSRDSEREKVFSPYSTFLMLFENPELCLENLDRLKRLGMLGEWGFYEAVDFTPSRTGGGHAIVKSYMAHHVGMSIISIANTLFDSVFVRRFMRDAEMGSAVELLQERIPVDAVILKNSVRRETMPKHAQAHLPDTQALCRNGERCAVTSLSGRDISVLLSESGIISVNTLGISALRDETSFLPFCRIGDEYFSPDVTEKSRFTYGKGYAQYKRDTQDIVVSASSAAPALRVRITSPDEKGIYIAPCAVERSAAISHPAYADLFFEGYFENRAVILEYHGKSPFYQCLVSNVDFEFELFREEVFSQCDATRENLFSYIRKTPHLSGRVGTLLSPCILARVRKKTPEVTFVIGYGKTSSEAVRAAKGELEKNHHTSICASDRFEKGLMSACGLRALDRVLSEKLLSAFAETEGFEICDRLPEYVGRERLWEVGISGDLPIAAVSVSLGSEILEKILRLHKYHYISYLRYDLVLICRDTGYKRGEHDLAEKLIDLCGCRFIQGASGGVFIVGKDLENTVRLASRVLIDCDADVSRVEKIAPFSIKTASPDYKKSGKPYGFGDGYTIDKASYTPEILWHHIIASDTFGTLVSTRGLGHSWVYNAGLSRLDRWECDRVGSAHGEKLYITNKGKTYDACDYATRVEFSAGAAVYYGDFYRVTVACHPTLMYKEIVVETDEEVTLLYKMEPVMGDGVMRAGRVFAERIGCGMIFSSPFSDTLSKGFGYILSPDGDFGVTANGLTTESKRIVVGYAGELKVLDTALRRIKRGSVVNDSVEFARSFLPRWEKTHFDNSSEYMYNYGLPLQCAVSRILARTGPYQSGGAWGCRDQAQDMLFMIDIHPERVRAHIFRMASHQYTDGDMQHWWHGHRGTRTRCSDDYLWFVLLLSEYIEKTDDVQIFDYSVYYRESSPLSSGERERYEYAARSDIRENLICHAKRCLDLFVSRGLGANGLPFMGSGDWNDGMDMIGNGGGESVWLGFFALTVFYKSFPMLERFGVDTSDWRAFCKRLYENIEENAYFSDRYARAFLKDGTPVGVRGADACQIDGIVTAFSSICKRVTGLGNPARISASLDTAWKYLYDEKTGIYKLFSPSFKERDNRIGYVSCYPEGIRENGGQYTHGAVFSALGYLWAPAEKRKNLERARKILDAILTCNRDPDTLKTEPYVLAADIYSNPTHNGRGGWSFYTGSAGWCRFLMREIEKELKNAE